MVLVLLKMIDCTLFFYIILKMVIKVGNSMVYDYLFIHNWW